MGNSSSNPDLNGNQVNLAQFESIRMIGKGSFGKVRMVRHVERRDECYAMKCISKEHCIKLNAVRNIIRERTILEQLAHPLVCNMRFAFHDASTMYMVMDLMLGGDMRFHISRQRHPENVIRFWMAELICAVKYLHFQGFVHRDIKPDNILLDQEGHIHLTDFNIACSIPRKPQSLLRSRSGTIVYFAPEVFKGHGYNEDVDWWSVGITFYECIYGKRPWPGNETAEELAQTVLRGTICYPSTEGRSVSPSCVSAIQGFLEYEPNNRLGHGTSGWNRLVQHPFFHSVNWNAIDTKQTTPPFRPSSSQGNFDAIYDIEDLLVHSSGSISPRAANWFFRSSQPSELDERRVRLLKEIDEKFKPFDYTIYDKYEGFLDPNLMTVGPPPTWVKPAFGEDMTEIGRLSMPLDLSQTSDSVFFLQNPLSQPCRNILIDVHQEVKGNNRSDDCFRKSSRTDSGCTFSSSMEELKNKRRTSAQSFKERRERDRRRSAGKIRQESNGALIATTD